MATNFEFYKDEILEISGNKMEIAIVNNRPVPCERTDCTDCDFQCNCSECYVVLWLYAEHIEQPKLTKRERAFCEYVGHGYIARDESDKKCYWFPDKPIKSDGEWCSDGMFMWVLNNVAPFAFIKWEDEKPWAVEDLLKLEDQHETD